MNQLLSTGNTPSMNSREIAELVGSRHDNVRVAIERLAARGVIEIPAMQEIPTATKPVAVYVFSGERGRRDSIVLVAQLSPEFTAALVDRWQALEAGAVPRLPQTLPEALRLAADLAEQNNRLQVVVSEQAPKVEALARIAEAGGSMCLTDAAKHLGTPRWSLINWMRENRWIYRREGNGRPVAYQPRITAGLLEHKVSVIDREGSDVKLLASQVLVTAKGLAVLAQKINGAPRSAARENVARTEGGNHGR